jgi:hypothetical protein
MQGFQPPRLRLPEDHILRVHWSTSHSCSYTYIDLDLPRQVTGCGSLGDLGSRTHLVDQIDGHQVDTARQGAHQSRLGNKQIRRTFHIP